MSFVFLFFGRDRIYFLAHILCRAQDLGGQILCDPLPRSCAAHRIRQTISCAQPATSCAPHRIMRPNFTGCGSHILCNPMSAQDMDRHILCHSDTGCVSLELLYL